MFHVSTTLTNSGALSVRTAISRLPDSSSTVAFQRSSFGFTVSTFDQVLGSPNLSDLHSRRFGGTIPS
ncbi:hypothetical protein VTN31DRAFT_3259 [Thermomyces dupontii]|uniref:uncharacterized protein n=1 Tax=Talaromyces thermophilus TaxID=28565 RepID=UPI0037436137